MKVRVVLRFTTWGDLVHLVSNATGFQSTELAVHISRADEWWPVSWPWNDIKSIEIWNEDEA